MKIYDNFHLFVGFGGEHFRRNSHPKPSCGSQPVLRHSQRRQGGSRDPLLLLLLSVLFLLSLLLFLLWSVVGKSMVSSVFWLTISWPFSSWSGGGEITEIGRGPWVVIFWEKRWSYDGVHPMRLNLYMQLQFRVYSSFSPSLPLSLASFLSDRCLVFVLDDNTNKMI